MGARHVLTIVAVEDVARASRFYASAFGWERLVEVPPYVEFALPEGRRFGVYDRRAFAANTGVLPALPPAGATTGAEIYLHVDDVAAAACALEAAGARLLSPASARGWGDLAAYYADPDGNVVVVAAPLAPA